MKLRFLYICAAVFTQAIASYGVPLKEDHSLVHYEKSLSSNICDNCMSQKDPQQKCKKVYKTCSSYTHNYNNVLGEFDRIIAEHGFADAPHKFWWGGAAPPTPTI